MHKTDDATGLASIIFYLETHDDFIVSYENLFEFNEEKPLCIFLSRRQLLQSALKYGTHVIGLDATFNVTYYRNVSLFAIMARSDGGALPLGYFVATAKNEVAVTIGLQLFLKATNVELRNNHSLSDEESYYPAAICIDKDEAEYAAIQAIFPQSLVILCHYHFMTLMSNELKATRHGLGPAARSVAINVLRQMSTAEEETKFIHCVTVLRSISDTFFQFFSVYYLNERWIHTFSELHRTHLPLSVRRLCRANMLTEVSFRTLKYVIFNGEMNKRFDDLVYSVQFRLIPYFLARHNAVMNCKPRFNVSLKSRDEGRLLFA